MAIEERLPTLPAIVPLQLMLWEWLDEETLPALLESCDNLANSPPLVWVCLSRNDPTEFFLHGLDFMD